MGAAPCWMFAIQFFRVWQTPLAVEGGRWVKFAIGIMCMELILVHSGSMFGFLATRKDPAGYPLKAHQWIAWMIGMAGLYLLFAGAISFSFKSPDLFYLFCWITASRLLSMFLDARAGTRVAKTRSGVSVALYLSSLFLSVFVPIPRAGLTLAVLAQIYPDRPSGGVWTENPQQALFAGMFYFGLLGLWELLASFRADRKPSRGQL